MLERLFASKKRPCFKTPARWDNLSFDLSGCKFELSLPPQDYEFAEEKHGDRFDLFDSRMYSYNNEPDSNGNPPHFEGISHPSILRRRWDIYGPVWRATPIGLLQCSAVICDISRMTSKLDCFNQAQMERLIMHGIYQSDGPGAPGGNESDTPVNWQIKTLHGVEWVYWESWRRKPEWVTDSFSNYETNFTVWMCTPLFSDKYLLVSFTSTGALPAKPINTLKLRRIQEIIQSFKLQLSEKSLAQKLKAENNFPGAHYSESRDPEPWRYYGSYRDGNILEGEDPIVFEGQPSPPPKLY